MWKRSNFALAALILAIFSVLIAHESSVRGDGIQNPGLSGLSGDCSASLGSTSLTCNLLPQPGYIVNLWYGPYSGQTMTAGAAEPANTITCHYGAIAQPITIGALGTHNNTIVAGGNYQLAVYRNVNSRPGVLLASTPSSGTGDIASKSSPITATIMGPGTANGRDFWWCFNTDVASATFPVVTNTGSDQKYMTGAAGLSTAVTTGVGTVGVTGYTCAGAACTGGSSAFGNWPATLVGSTWTDVAVGTVPYIVFQVQSVP